MRLALLSRTLLLLAMPAVVVTCVDAQDHPNVQPSKIANQLNQAPAASQPAPAPAATNAGAQSSRKSSRDAASQTESSGEGGCGEDPRCGGQKNRQAAGGKARGRKGFFSAARSLRSPFEQAHTRLGYTTESAARKSGTRGGNAARRWDRGRRARNDCHSFEPATTSLFPAGRRQAL
jgi:hypothetical protein